MPPPLESAPTLASHLFYKTFTHEDFVTENLRIDGQIALAPAALLEMAIAAAEFAAQPDAVSAFTDFYWLSPVLLTRGEIRIKLLLEQDGSRFSVTFAEEEGKRFAHTGLHVGRKAEQTHFEPQLPDSEEIANATCYRHLERSGFEYGPAFRVIDEIRMGRTSMRARLQFYEPASPSAPLSSGEVSPSASSEEVSPSASYPNGNVSPNFAHFRLHPALLEGLFQASSFFLSHTGGKNQALTPTKLASLHIFGSTPRCLIAHLSKVAESTVDICVTDPDGRPLLHFCGLEMAPIATGSPAVSDLNPSIEKKVIEGHLLNLFAKQLQMVAADLSSDKTFDSYGLDSFLTLRLLKLLEQDYGPLPKTLLFEYPTLRSLATYLMNRGKKSTDFKERLTALLGEQLQVDGRLEPDRPFASYGMDSFLTLRIIKLLEREFGTLPKTLLFDYPNLEVLTDYLVGIRQTQNGDDSVTPEETLPIRPDSVSQIELQAPLLLKPQEVQLHPGLQKLAESLLAEHGLEVNALARRSIAPLLFFGTKRNAFFYANRDPQNMLAFCYVGPPNALSDLSNELATWCQANDLLPHILSEMPLEHQGDTFSSSLTAPGDTSSSTLATLGDTSSSTLTAPGDTSSSTLATPGDTSSSSLAAPGDTSSSLTTSRIHFSGTPFAVMQRIPNLAQFSLEGRAMRRLRYLVTKFEKLGFCRTIEFLGDPTEATAIAAVIDAWCCSRTMVNPYIWDVKAEILTGRLPQIHRIFLTYLDEVLQNAIVITAMPGDRGYLMDLEFYPSEMPLGGLEFGIVQIITKLQTESQPLFSLGATFGAQLSENGGACEDQMLRQLRERGIFDGSGNLQFKNKFRPENRQAWLYRPADSDPASIADVIMMIANPGGGERKSTIRAQKSPEPPARLTHSPNPPDGQHHLESQIYPLSSGQKGLWFHCLAEPESHAYNTPFAYLIESAIDPALLKQAFKALAERHPALRTVFKSEAGDPLQVVQPFLEPDFERKNLPDSRDLMSTLHDFSRRPFDLETGPPLRVLLLHQGADQYLAFVLHHLIFDGTSFILLMHELDQIYGELTRGLSLPSLQPQPSYARFVAEQQEFLGSEEAERQWAWWQAQLSEPLPAAPLISDRIHTAASPRQGDTFSRALDSATWRTLTNFALAIKVSRFHCLIGLWSLLLHRHSGESDVVVGMPLAGRTAFPSTIGYFVNMAALRTDFGDDPDCRSLLSRTRDKVFDIMANGDLPFAEIVSRLHQGRESLQAPLFQTAFVLQEWAWREAMANLKLVPIPGIHQTGEYDLTLEIHHEGDAATLLMKYDAALFDETTVRLLTDQFVWLVTNLPQYADRPVSNLPLMDEAARDNLLSAWNATVAPLPDVCVHQRFAAMAATDPARIALIQENQQISYMQLGRLASALANFLLAQGLLPGEPVGILMDRNLPLVVAMIAILKAGGAYLPLDPAYPQKRLRFMAQDAGLRRIVVGPGIEPEQYKTFEEFQLVPSDGHAAEIPRTSFSGDPGLPAYIMYTSGSTGKPKGTLVPHRAIIRLLCNSNFIALGSDDRVAQVANAGFDAATFEIWGPLLHGGAIVIAHGNTPLSTADFATWLKDKKITAMFLTAALFNQHAAAQPDMFATLDTLIVGGEALDPPSLRRVLAHGPPRRLLNGYGPTECTTFSCWHLITGIREGTTSVPIGAPIANTTCHVLDRKGRLVAPGLPGELFIGGPGLALGYHARPMLTAEKFVPNPFGQPGTRLYRSGDRVRLHASGALLFLGRFDDQIKMRGFRIELSEIEAVLADAPGIDRAVVLLRNQPEKQLIGYLIPHSGKHLESHWLRGYLAQRLPEYMIPSVFVQLDAFPLTANGKIDKLALPAPTPDASAATDSPQDPLVALVGTLWTELTGIDCVTIHDNFFACGGHSLLATKLIARLHQATGRELAIRDFFAHPTVAGLADLLRRGSGVSSIPELLPSPRSEEAPLSFAQERLWFIDRLEPGNPVYNIPYALRLEGPVDRAALQDSLATLARHHEILRSYFLERDGQPVQKIAADLLPVLRFTKLPAKGTVRLEEILLEEARTPFQLDRPPLIRCHLMELAGDEHVLLLNLHHIIADGWSLEVLLRQLEFCYHNLLHDKKTPTLATLPVQYADYAIWQRNWLQGDLLKAELAFWRQELSGAPATLDLPTDKLRPPNQGFSGALVPFHLDFEIASALTKLGRKQGNTLFTTLLTAFKVFLCRLSGQTDLCLGIPVAGRGLAALEEQIGFFANSLVLRTDLGDNPPFLDLLAKVQHRVVRILSHAHLPFEKLVEELKPLRDPGRNPLFQVAFSFQNLAPPPLPSLHAKRLVFDPGVAHFDLTCYLEEGAPGTGLAGALEYRTDLFQKASVEHMRDLFLHLLKGFASHPTSRILDLPLLDEQERARILIDWNDTANRLPNRSLHQLFEDQVRRTPQTLAVQDGDVALTYEALNRQANQTAHALVARCLTLESPVGIQCDRTWELVVAALAILKASACYLPLDPKLPVNRRILMAEDAGLAILLLGRDQVAFGAYATLVIGASEQADLPPDNLKLASNPLQIAYLMYTSGSTGRPKGIDITHRSVVRLVRQTDYMRFSANDRVAQVANAGFDAATFEIWGALLNGGCTVGIGTDAALSTSVFAQALSENAISVLFLTTALFNQHAAEQPQLFGCLDTLLIGGEAADASRVQSVLSCDSPPRRLLNMYGPTECTTFATWHCARPADARNLPIGRPTTNTTCFVLDRCGWPVPPGVTGELCIGGPGLARGYRGRPDLTAATFRPNPFGPAGERLYHSGDLVRLHLEGHLMFVGRGDHQVKIRGFRIEPGEIEEALADLPEVGEAAVLVHDDPHAGKTLVAYITAKKQADSLDARSLKARLLERLPAYMVPSSILELDAFPLTANGKLDRSALPLPTEEPRETPVVTPRNKVEERLAQTWSTLLNIDTVGIHDNFFDLGGHSLLVTRIISRISDEWRVSLPVRTFFSRPTIAELAAEITQLAAERQRNELPPIVAVDRSGPLPLSFAQRRMWLLYRLEENSSAYHMPVALTLKGRLDTRSFSMAISTILARHEVLRTAFGEVTGEPVQLVQAHTGGHLFDHPGGHLSSTNEPVSPTDKGGHLSDAPGGHLSATNEPVSPTDKGGHLSDAHPSALNTRSGGHLFYHSATNEPVSPTDKGGHLSDAHPRSLNTRSGGHLFYHPGGHLFDSPQGEQVPLIDLAGFPVAERLARAQHLLIATARRPFDLSTGPLLRCCLLRLDPETHLVIFVMHHIAFDGWSLAIFTHELSLLYASILLGNPIPLPLPTLQYGDFAHWQQTHFQSGSLGDQLTYWTAKLAGELPVLPLADPPGEHEVPGSKVHMTDLDLPLSTAIGNLARQNGATSFMLMLSAFKLLLFRLTDEPDIIVGTPVSGRNRPGVEQMLGCFLNTLALRSKLKGSVSFRDLLSDIRETTLQAFAHEDLPFEQLIEALQPTRNLNRHPICDVFFNYVHRSQEELVLPGIVHEIAFLETLLSSVDARFMLELYVVERDAGLSLRFVYKSGRLSPARIRCLAEQYRYLLEQIVAAPDMTIGRYSLVQPESRFLLPDGAEPLEEPTLPNVPMSLTQYRRSTSPAVRSADHVWTYAELLSSAQAIADCLVARGLQSGQTVALHGPVSFGFIAALLGVLQSGATLLTLDPHLPSDRRATMLQQAGARFLLAGASPPALEGIPFLPFDPATGLPVSPAPASQIGPQIDPNSPAYLFFTSGTTGLPKGVLGCHKGLSHFLHWQRRAFRVTAEDRCAQLTGLSFDVVLRDILLPLTSGATLYLPSAEIADPSQILPWLARMEITLFHTVPSIARSWLAEPPVGVDLSRVRLIFFAGEPLTATLVSRWRRTFGDAATIVNLYGPTETTLAKCYYRVPRDPQSGDQPVGEPLPQTQALVLNTEGQACGIGEPGEVAIRTPFRSLGYLDGNNDRFRVNPSTNDPSDLLYLTGDRGRFRPDGLLELLGRLDFQVKIRGVRVEPGEVAAALAGYPSVTEAVVLARKTALGGPQLVAYVIAAPRPEPEDLIEFLRPRLMDAMIPAAFVFLNAFPLTANGKLDRTRLPEPDLLTKKREHHPPRTPVERDLANIWVEVLHLERVGVDDHFFALGGHSLLATRITARIQGTFGVALPLRAIFEAPTLAALATRIESVGGTPAEVRTILHDPGRTQAPLSFAQQRLWFLDRLEGPSPTYTMFDALQIDGPLKPDLLARAFNEVRRRQGSLRTTFPAEDGKPKQLIHPHRPQPLPIIDFSSLPDATRKNCLRPIITLDSGQPFLLDQGPLFRTRLLRFSTGRHVLLLAMSHIISDAWSIRLLVTELMALYEVFLSDQEPNLPEPPIQYVDYAVWESEHLLGPTLEDRLEWWQTYLAGAPVLIELPTDRPRPASQTFAGDTLPVFIEARHCLDLTRLGQGRGATLFMTIQAAFALLLSRYSRQNDILIGTPVANRDRQEVEALIGFFANTLPLRCDLAGDPSFNDLLDRVRESTLNAFAHGDLPFEKLVEEIRPERSLSHNPIFQVMFVLQHLPALELQAAGLRLTPLDKSRTDAKFDLNLNIAEHGAGISGLFEYNTDLFDRATAARMLAHLTALLRAVAANPHLPVSSYDLLDADERRQVLGEWNATWDSHPPPDFLSLFTAIAEARPRSLAARHGGRNLTFGKLDQMATRLAHRLIDAGLTPDRPAGIYIDRSFEMLTAVLAVLKAGGAYVPLDPDYPPDRIALMLEDAGIDIVLSKPALADRLASFLVTVLWLDADIGKGKAIGEPLPQRHPEQLAYLIYTSGSTGRPKGVALSRGALDNVVAWQLKDKRLRRPARTLQFASLSFDVSFQEMFSTWATGGCLVLVNEMRRRDMAALLNEIIANRIERLFLPFIALQHLAAFALEQDRLPVRLREVITAGEQLQATDELCSFFARLPECRLYNHYGPSETHVVTALALSAEPKSWDTLPPIGCAIANTEIYLLDSRGRPVPIGVAGELYIGGTNLARGYYGQASLTAVMFQPHPFTARSGARLYRTGDLARYRLDGNLLFMGRADDQTKIRGYRIEPGEIAAALMRHEAVREAVVLVRSDEGPKRLVAYIQPVANATADTGTLRSFLGQTLPEYMVPAAFIFLQVWPLTPSGKIDRRNLPKPVQEDATTRYKEPRGPVAELLASIWSKVLGVARVGDGDHFFELGGHSLLATQIAARVQTLLGVALPIRAIFQFPILSALAAHITAIRQDRDPAAPATIPITDRNRPLPLSFSQRRLWFLDRLEGANATYNLTGAVRLLGMLDSGAFEQALAAIVARHESLRTKVKTLEGEGIQVIEDGARLRLQHFDLAALKQEDRLPRAQRLIDEEATAPFHLDQGPLCRLKLLRLEADDHIFMLTMSHLISDGWSADVFFRELHHFYTSFLEGRPPSLEPLSLQYADYAAWQRDRLQGERLLDLLAWWRQHLDGAPSVIDLPTDRPRPATRTFAGASVPVSLAAALSDQVTALARERGVTLFMVLKAAFATLLHRLSGQDDVVIGTSVANRERTEFEAMIGFFVNSLALRTNFSHNPSFAQLLASERESLLGAYAHQELPFEKLVEELRPERNLAYNAIFQVYMVLQNTPGEQLPLPGLKAEVWGRKQTAAKFDLNLHLAETEHGIEGSLTYNTDIFDAAAARCIADQWRILLAGIVGNPECRVGDYSLIGEGTILPDPTAPLPTPDYPLVPALLSRFRGSSAIAVSQGQREWSYNQLINQADNLVFRLRSRGLERGQVVAIHGPTGFQMVAALTAVLLSGGVLLPIDPELPEARRKEMIGEAGACMVIDLGGAPGNIDWFRLAHLDFGIAKTKGDTSSKDEKTKGDTSSKDEKTKGDTSSKKPDASDAGGTPAEGDTSSNEKTKGDTSSKKPDASDAGGTPAKGDTSSKVEGDTSSGSAPSPIPICGEDAAYIFFTSGTTGRPKAILGTHQGLAHFLDWQRDAFAVGPGDRCSQLTSLSFDALLRDVFLPLTSGATLCLPELEDLASVPDWLARERISLCHTVPSLALSWLARHEGITPLNSLRHLFLSGEPFDDRLVTRWRHTFPGPCEIVNFYGPTETTMIKCYYRVPAVPVPGLQPAGVPLPDTHVLIYGPGWNPRAVGEVGEVFLRTPFMTRGYLNDPAAQASAFVPNPNHPAERLYRTGDLGRYRADGSLQLVGRCDRQIKIRGVRIELSEIERALVAHPAVLEAAVLADSGGQASLTAYLVSKEAINTEALLTHLARQLPAALIPGRFLFLERFPLTNSGKLDRRALSATAMEAKTSNQVLNRAGDDLGRTHSPEEVFPMLANDGSPSVLKEEVSPYSSSRQSKEVSPYSSSRQSEEVSPGVTAVDAVEWELIRIWEEVIKRKPIGRDDNFFAVGGHSLLATLVMARIKKQFGFTLPLATLFREETIAKLAVRIREKTGRLAIPSAPVTIKEGSGRLPLFLVHHAGGNVFNYLSLARFLPQDQPLYGFESPGLAGEHPPLETIEALAAHHLKSMSQVATSGPYLLGGWSLGGIVAYEMARQLRQAGETVAALVLFDSRSPNLANEPLPDGALELAFAGVLTMQFGAEPVLTRENLVALPKEERVAHIEAKARAAGLPASFSSRILANLYQVFQTNLNALARYQANPYEGTLTLFRASDRASERRRKDPPDLGWGELLQRPPQIIDVPGTHHTLFDPGHIEVLAEELAAILETLGQS